jgi:hypothetical protein
VAEFCGDGTVNNNGTEQCDDGGQSAACDTDCTTATCGDSTVNAAAGEACDSGGVQTVACEANCTAPTCGDGILNTAAGEVCDDGVNDGTSGSCSPDCLAAIL